MNGDLKVQLDRYGGYRHGYNTLNAKERKGNSIVDTNVSLSDAEHPTQKESKHKLYILFFLK